MLICVSVIPFIFTPTPGNVNLSNFGNYLVGIIKHWGVLVGICFSPIAILVSIYSFYKNKQGIIYFLAILAINLPFVLLVYFGLRTAASPFQMLGSIP
jgi:hypothetical protein